MICSKRHLIVGLLCVTFAGLLTPHVALAQPRIFASVNFGSERPASGQIRESATAPSRGELMSRQNDYRVPNGMPVDASAGLMLTRWFGVAAGVSRFSSRDEGNYSLTLPQPVLYNAPVTHQGATTSKLEHTQRALHLSVVLVPKPAERLSLRFFVGPSKVAVSQAVIDRLEISETPAGSAPYDFTIQRAVIGDSAAACACAWGFHAGIDTTRFLTRRLGIGAMLRYSRAIVELKDAARTDLEGTLVTHRYAAGGLVAGGGVRLRF